MNRGNSEPAGVGMKKQYYYIKYDIDTKTQTEIVGDKIVRTYTFEFCPYVWFGKLKEKIESGLIKYVMWKNLRLIPD